MASLKVDGHVGAVFRLLLIFLVAGSTLSASGTLRIAAASNLVFAVETLANAFREVTPELKVEVVTGASGNLVAQITHGAPYDVFMSADLAYPQALVATGQADAASLTPFATGRLVLWTTRSDLPMTDLGAVLHDARVRKIAIANIDTAPYGRAARQTLEKLGRWTALQSQLVIGENISQTAQFVASGNADAGFVALSLVMAPEHEANGSWLVVPDELHSPLTQGAVLTKHGTTNPAALVFLKFLGSEDARKIFARHGYGMPPSP
ncbi:MAG: molybdate ABC transporter substrate-binding protein [Cephaloticoccus sp.]|nr:molybdate ABC transporter substrate-binding protein [Cephaloticoccus sp.]